MRRTPDTAEGFLRRSIVSPITQQRYLTACAAVVAFSGGPKPRCDDLKAWDQILVRFIEHTFLLGEAVSVARYALYGVIYSLDLARRSAATLPLAKATVRAFTKRAPESSRDPPPIEWCWLLLDCLIAGAASGTHLLTAAFAFLSLDSYLRPSEALALRKRDVCPPRRGAAATGWALTIAPQGGAPAKNQQFDAGVIVGSHDRGWVCKVLELLYLACDNDDDFLFKNLALTDVERVFREYSRKLRFKILPHGMRHAGPSHDAVVHHVRIEDIFTRGRWLALDSCRRYAKPAALLRQLRVLTPQQLAAAKDISEKGPNDLICKLRGWLGFRPEGRKRKRQ